MNNPILLIAAIAVALGIIVGGIIVGVIYFQRRRQAVDSLIRIDNVVGSFGVVEVPLNNESPGKVRVNLKGSLVDFVAFSDEIHQFNQGDSVVVVRINGNKVWVVSV